ncbi:MAG: OmpA family protein [Thauera sp.]|jgi:outer membrane protein OmpA-like peptidoglycan-associated protein|nr:OmpA family protein [Thauera sp.]
MFDQEDGDIGIALGVVFGLLALVIALVIGLGSYQLRGKAATTESAIAAESALANAAVFRLEGVDVEFVDVAEEGELLAKVYFALGQKEPGEEAAAALEPVIAALNADAQARALLSGYHDESGGAAVNAQVAAARAVAVRAALLEAGVDAGRILLRRPAVTLGGSDANEARRVEVRIQ